MLPSRPRRRPADYWRSDSRSLSTTFWPATTRHRLRTSAHIYPQDAFAFMSLRGIPLASLHGIKRADRWSVLEEELFAPEAAHVTFALFV